MLLLDKLLNFREGQRDSVPLPQFSVACISGLQSMRIDHLSIWTVGWYLCLSALLVEVTPWRQANRWEPIAWLCYPEIVDLTEPSVFLAEAVHFSSYVNIPYQPHDHIHVHRRLEMGHRGKWNLGNLKMIWPLTVFPYPHTDPPADRNLTCSKCWRTTSITTKLHRHGHVLGSQDKTKQNKTKK